MPFACTFFLKMGRYGWSETFINNVADRATALARSKALAEERLEWQSTQCFLPQVRVSDVSIQGDSHIEVFPRGGPGGYVGTKNGENPPVSILVRLDKQDGGSRKHIYARGVPDGVLVATRERPTDEEWTPHFNSWLDKLKDANEGWGWLSTVAPGVGTPITLAEPAAVAVTFTTPAAHGYVIGQRFRVKGMRPSYWNKEYVVRDVPDVTKIITLHNFEFNPLIIVNGFIHDVLEQFTPIQRYAIVRTVSRKTGRPFDSPRGRGRD